MIFEMFLIKLFLGVVAATAVVAVACISYEAIKSWYSTRTVSKDMVTLTRASIADAIHVKADIRGQDGVLKDTQAWKSETMDAETKAAFAGRDKVVMKVS